MISFLFVDSERVWRGGQDQLFTLLRGLTLRGHHVSLICHPGTLLETRAREIGVRVFPIAFRRCAWLISLVKCWLVLRQVKPDVLAFNTPRPILLCGLASKFAPVRIRLIFRRVNFPLRRNPITRLKYTWGIDCIVAISESIGSQLKSGGIPASRIHTIYEGIDLAPYPRTRPARSRTAGDPKVVGTVAHLSPEKGLSNLIEAASLIPDTRTGIRFVIVGEGECRNALEEQARRAGLRDRIQFVGFQDTPAKFLSEFDVFVLPSLSEGLSSAILTAMATGLPVVATDVGGIPELIHHGQNGLLVPPGNAAALAEAIAYLLDHSEKAIGMGRKGRELLEERFTLDRKITETEQLCLSLLKDAPREPRKTDDGTV
jgi:glycosyltransferase involved in cell wall biosynthesis